MCNYLFIAADQPLPAVTWNAECPGVTVCIAKPTTAEGLREWMTKPHIYDVGSHVGSACPFACEPDWDNLTDDDLQEWNESREDFRQLASYLETAVALSGPLELYTAIDYWLPPLLHRSVRVQDLLGERFVFEERELVIVTGP